MENNVKQVILVRTDLKMSVGKIASQVAHASMKAFFDVMIKAPYIHFLHHNQIENEIVESAWPDSIKFTESRILPRGKYFNEYIEGIFKKVVVGVESEKELLELYQKAKDKEIHCSLIKDSGLTEFNLVPTYTTVCIGPWIDSEIDEITGHLKLLK